jgi:tetratricopeptide (TPR) repeat protein
MQHILIGFIAAIILISAGGTATAQSDVRECSGKGGGPDAIIAGCTRILERGRDSTATRAVAHYNRGSVYRDRSDYDRAIEDYTAAIRLDPRYAAPHNGRGIAYRYKGDPDRALVDLEAAIRLKADNPSYHHNRANVYLDLAQYDRAIADYGNAIRLNPKFSLAFSQRAAAFRRKGDYERSIADYDKAIELNPKNVVAVANRAFAYRHKGELDRALVDYDAALALDPRFAPAYFGRAASYEIKGDIGKALIDYRLALAIEPKHEKARLAIQRIEARLAAPQPIVVPGQPPAPARPENRIALIIGNGTYAHAGALTNPPNDAKTFAALLRQVGFTKVMLTVDLSRAKIIEALKAFAAEADKADWAVVYYAGHGIEVGGVNYLVPIDAKLKSDAEVPNEAVELEQVLGSVEGARKLRLIILDACRDNPFIDAMARTVTNRATNRGFGNLEPEGATLVAYAAKHGQTALDGDGANSPFMSSLAKHVDTPGLEIALLFRRVRDDVYNGTGRRQEPYIYGSLPAEQFFFRRP